MEDYPKANIRNRVDREKFISAIDCILSNIKSGRELIIRNFSRLNAEDIGFSRDIFLGALAHLDKAQFVARETREKGGETSKYTRSILTFSARIKRYQPTRIIFQPEKLVRVNLGGGKVAKVNSAALKELKAKLREVHSFYLQHKIITGIDNPTFDLFNDYQVEVRGKEPLIFPDPEKILPAFVFNDRDLTKGGRMYGAFWIGESKNLRRAIQIDGELTADIDGKAMHVQLLYRRKGIQPPSSDLYLFTDERRAIAKKAMLLMMNTVKPMSFVDGRKAVERTYKKHHGKVDGLDQLILELENYHSQIADQFYRPNWGDLQRTEGAIMLSIMEAGMHDGVVILPVHDGCLCPRKDRGQVLNYFRSQGIDAAENLSHLQGLPIDETRDALAAVRKLMHAERRKISVCIGFEKV
ncbi:MAG: hypothetical protein V2B20_18995 [Pseudomonadota bacterium]